MNTRGANTVANPQPRINGDDVRTRDAPPTRSPSTGDITTSRLAMNLAESSAQQRSLFVVDGDTGERVHLLPTPCAGTLTAVGDNAVAARNAVDKPTTFDVWVGLDTQTPRLVKLERASDDYARAACSPKPGVVACAVGENVRFYRVA